MSDWTQIFKITVALIAIVNPIGGIPVFISATHDWDQPARAQVARIVAATVLIVLALAAFFGIGLLSFFGISIASFLVGGGILLLLLSISMLQARESPLRQTHEEAIEAHQREAVGVVPLGIPLLAGPGAISSVIISSKDLGGGWFGGVLMLIPIITTALVVWVTFTAGVRISQRIGTTGINIITRLMGLVLAAIAIELIAKGLIGLFPQLGSAGAV